MHCNVQPDALPGSATYVRVLDCWLMDCLLQHQFLVGDSVAAEVGSVGTVAGKLESDSARGRSMERFLTWSWWHHCILPSVSLTRNDTGPVFRLITPGNHRAPWWHNSFYLELSLFRSQIMLFSFCCDCFFSAHSALWGFSRSIIHTTTSS